MKVTVTDGAVVIESVDVVVEHGDVVILYVNCASKYPSPWLIQQGGSTTDLLMMADERTLGLRAGVDREQHTRVHLELDSPDGWTGEAFGGRYHAVLILWKFHGLSETRNLWVRETTVALARGEEAVTHG